VLNEFQGIMLSTEGVIVVMARLISLDGLFRVFLGGVAVVSKVAVVEFDEDYSESFKHALNLIGGVEDLNTFKRNVVIKVGLFHPRCPHHSSVDLVKSLVENFDKAPKIFLAESDNYVGKALKRLQVYENVFTDRVVPFSLSESSTTKRFKIADEEMDLSHVMLKPNVFVDTHVLRNFPRGSILKNRARVN
jgi:hypothetical protein